MVLSSSSNRIERREDVRGRGRTDVRGKEGKGWVGFGRRDHRNKDRKYPLCLGLFGSPITYLCTSYCAAWMLWSAHTVGSMVRQRHALHTRT